MQMNRRLVAYVPTFGEILLMITMASAFLTPEGPSRLLGDGDTGTHLRTGQMILETGTVPKTDPYSFTRPGQRWYAWEWAWDVAFAKIDEAGGLTAVALVTLAILCITFYWLYRHSLARSDNPVIAVMVTGLCMIESSNHWLARPHAVSFLFLVFAIWWIERNRATKWKVVLVLPLLTIAWANIHGGFVLLIPILASYSCGAFLRALTSADRKDRKAESLNGLTYAIAGGLCLLASLVNPYGWLLLKHILVYLQERAIRERTLEFLPPDLTRIPLLFLFSLDLLAILWFALRKQYEYCLLIGGTAYMALGIVRHISVHSVICAPFLAEAAIALGRSGAARLPQWPFGELLTGLIESGDELKGMKTNWRSFALPVFLAALLLTACVKSTWPRFQAHIGGQRFPQGAIKVLKNETGSLRVFSDDETGDYVIYSLYPHAHVFIDGRLDFYGPALLPEYDKIVLASFGYEKILNHYDVNTLLLDKTFDLVKAVQADARWKKLYEDKSYIVFRR